MAPQTRADTAPFRRRRAVAATTALAVVATVAVIWKTESSSPKVASGTTTSTVNNNGVGGSSSTAATVPKQTTTLAAFHETSIATLGHALADPGVGVIGNQVVFAGGLDASSTSTGRIGALSGATVSSLGTLPTAMHDAASAGLNGAVYLFGGGTATQQLDTVFRIAADGTTTKVATLPSRSSDSIAATIGSTAYVVGGYDGVKWLDTIVAFTPGAAPRVVAHMPIALRYPAVAAFNGAIVIAGGTTPTVRATSAIYSFAPTTKAISIIGSLPNPITHASAIASGDEVVVLGGFNGAKAPQSAVVAIQLATKRIRRAGSLSTARSDTGIVVANGKIVIVGGKSAAGAVTTITELVAARTIVHQTASNVYEHAGAGMLTGEARSAVARIYVPNSDSNTVDVIDPATFKVIDHFAVGGLPQHITPSWDFKTLYVDNDQGNSLTPINPRTGKPGTPIPVTDPYNLYFTPDGKFAIVVAEAQHRLDFRDAQTLKVVKAVPVPCRGVDHMDYTADGTTALASCEFSGQMLIVDLVHQGIVKTIDLPKPGSKPQDVKLSPDGATFYVADMANNGVWEINAQTFAINTFMPTGAGTHGLYPSRDAKNLYISNRGSGTISVMSFATGAIVTTWRVPGGSPDMGGVSVDGKVLWLSGRYNAEVYAISTTDGHLLARIPVGRGPHGLSVWPQPGRYSIGHTGITR